MLDYHYFKEHYKLIAINRSKQQAQDGVSKAMQKNNFTENLDKTGKIEMLSIIEKAK